MQQSKSTKKIEQIEKVSKSEKEISDNIYTVMKKFGLVSVFRPFDKVKRSGALILDDTTVAKTGKNIERVGYVHDHVSQSFVLGYKILVAGYWDGVSFIPIDFSIHREKRDTQIKKVQKQIEKMQAKIKSLKKKETQLSKKSKVLKQEIKHLSKLLKDKPLKTKEKQLALKTASLEKNTVRIKAVKQELKHQNQKLYNMQNTYYELDKKSFKKRI